MASFELTDTAESWPVISTEDLHRDDWVVALRADIVTTPDGGDGFRRLAVEHPGAAMVMAVDDDERVHVQTQYRHPVQQRLVELPAGLCDVPGEDPLEVARRELLEEAALEATDWTHLLSTWSTPGDLERVLPRYVAQAGGQLDQPLPHRVAVLRLHVHPLVVVDGHHHRGARVLDHQPAEALTAVGRGQGVGADRDQPVVTVQVLGGRDGPRLGGVTQLEGRHGPTLPAEAQSSSLRRSSSSIGNRSSFWRSIAAPTRPLNSGCGRVGRERSSGCAWVAT